MKAQHVYTLLSEREASLAPSLARARATGEATSQVTEMSLTASRSESSVYKIGART